MTTAGRIACIDDDDVQRRRHLLNDIRKDTEMIQRLRAVRHGVSLSVLSDALARQSSSRLHPLAQRRTVGSATNNVERRVAATRQWVESIVVGEKLCPFAPPLLQNDGQLLRIVPSQATNEEQAVKEVAFEANLLVGDGWDSKNGIQPETTLLVMDAPFVHNFKDLVHLSWTLQAEAVLANGHAEKLQLVLFHPLATHQTYSSSLDDNVNPGDYTIRSPFPTIHLLREADVTRSVRSGYPDLESLPARNQARLISQGLSVCKSRLERCYQNDDNVDLPS